MHTVRAYTTKQALNEITNLVELFHTNKPSLLNVSESQIEQNYVRKLFSYLNWNVDNENLLKPEWEFVINKTNERGKRPDYIIQLEGQQLFVMDAKRIEDIHETRWMQQVYVYAYSTQKYPLPRKIDFAVLTNFQHFLLFDCTLYAADPQAVRNFLILDWTCDDYIKQFDMLWELFERENMRNSLPTRGKNKPIGLWDRYLSAEEAKANRIPPDEAFLAEMDDENDGWRIRLAKDMKKNNPQADGDLITAAVQLLINRLIFVKALSDREIEDDYLSMLAEQVEKSGLADTDIGWFSACRDVFSRLNRFYNGNIFESRPELEAITVSNKVVRSVIRDLEPDNSHYNFAILPIEILGTIYERFLGRVVHTTDQRVRIVDKPTARKEIGAYYTPQYVVDYILDNTVGKLLTNCKDPIEVSSIKILDPSCGSGSFLVGAYARLIQWYEQHYSAKKKLTRYDRTIVYRDNLGSIRLSAKIKRQILLDNIFGVDIDPQAVEVTCFSLSLKALEDTRHEELYQELDLFKQTVLPDLSENIKCGNSLIGSDYFNAASHDSQKELQAINPFDWKQQFSKLLKGGGFDVIVGNPPYLFITELDEDEKVYFRRTYATMDYRYDVYGLFIELSVTRLLKPGSILSFIIPHTLLSNDSFEKLRRYIITSTQLLHVLDIGPGIFKAKNETMIFSLKRANIGFTPDLCTVEITDAKKFPEPSRSFYINQQDWLHNPHAVWQLKTGPKKNSILSKLVDIPCTLKDLCSINQGLRTGDNEKYLSNKKQSSIWKPAIGGRDIDRFYIQPIDKFVYYKPSLLDAPRKPEIFESKEKIVVQEVRNITLKRRIVAAYDNKQLFCLQTTNVINLKATELAKWNIRYLLGIINSTLINYFFCMCFQGNNHIASNQLKQIPIIAAPNKLKEELIALVDSVIKLKMQLQVSNVLKSKTILQRQILSVDQQIDTLIYKIYDIDEDEPEIQLTKGE
jgi:hypothetical protein